MANINQSFAAHALLKSTLLFIACWLFTVESWGQLDTVHYIPPGHSRSTSNVSQYLYLSTPEPTSFQVTISYLTFNINTASFEYIDSTVTIANSAPLEFHLGGTDYSSFLVPVYQLNQPLTNRGIILKGTKRFYANLRVRQGDQAGSLTAKGGAGLGKIFRVGHLINGVGGSLSNFIGVMATEDNTQVSISGYNPGIAPQNGDTGTNDVYTPGNVINFTLNAGESYVLSVYCKNAYPANTNGLIGSLISSSKPIAVNCGSWWANHPNAGQDIGIDQIAPLERTGTEYILARGAASFTNTSNNLETPIVVAHSDNTEVFINGSFVPQYTINSGQYVVVPPSYYTNGQNMYVKTSKPVFMYQSLAGGTNTNNAAMSFIPPISCQIGPSVNNIPKINLIGSLSFTGSLFIITQANCPPIISTTGNNGTLFGPYPVTGNPSYVTYDGVGYTGNLKVFSSCPIQVGVLGRSGARGWDGYFSGFDIVYAPEVALQPNAQCPDTLFLQKKYINGGVTWYLNNQVLNQQPQVDSVLAITQPGEYMVIGKYITFCDEEVFDTAYYIVPDNFFSVATDVTPLNCGATQQPGQITVQVTGNGTYQYSLDNGTFGPDPTFTVSTPGLHTVQVQDQQGCVKTLPVNVEENLPTMLTATLCPGASIEVNGTTYNHVNPTGTEYIPRPGSCDSIIVVLLNALPQATGFLNATVCKGEIVVIDTIVFDENNLSGTVILQNASVFGCDSIVEVNLQFLPKIETHIETSSCNPADTGVVVQVLQSYQGCDSTVITTTKLTQTLFLEKNKPVCRLSEVGRDTFYFGCDSVVYVNKLYDLAGVAQSNRSEWVCQSSEVGIDTFLLVNISGCDSLDIVERKKAPIDSTMLQQTTCNPNNAGEEVVVLQNQYGCDSIVTTIINYEPSSIPVAYITQYTCHPDEVGEVASTYKTPEGCDSLVVVTTYYDVNLKPVLDVDATDESCYQKRDGRILLDVIGGTQPFLYSINGDGPFQNR
ncbi:MAG: IgGFc-binding protein [Saprospiraceae bacterium]|nr:IgGFc-binding protein [Saprospiraceae bacterium]